MKIVIALISLFIASQAFAFDLCSLKETHEIEATASKVSKNGKRFTFHEKTLIHRTISLENFYQGVSRPEALELFQSGSNEGEVVYYEIDGQELILVHYWPGDNEYGAFYEVQADKKMAKLVASVVDSAISCIQE